MPEEVIRAIMSRRNPRTGRNFTRDEAEAMIARSEHHPSFYKMRKCPKCARDVQQGPAWAMHMEEHKQHA